MTPVFLLIVACAISLLVIPLAVRLAPRLGLMDAPDPRKVHKDPIPRVGGWGIAAGTLVPLLLIFEADRMLQSFACGVVVLFLFGLWDDARELGHWIKFIGQTLAAAVVVFYGGLHVSRLPFLGEAAISTTFGQLFTMFAMVGAINAINHSDGLDGLAGGESVLGLLAIAYLGYLAQSPLVTGMALTTIGGTFGFLRYNTHPARVFMGDCGSQVLGFSLAFLVVYLSQVANPAMSPMVPVLLLGLPLTDILVVLYKRARGGMNWFRATRNHVHHRLLDLGLTHFESVVCIYLLQSILVLSGMLLQYESDYVLAAIYALTMLVLFGGLHIAESLKLRRTNLRLGQQAATLSHFVEAAWFRRLVLGFIGMLVPVFLLAPAGWASGVPRDVGVLSAALATGLGLVLVFPVLIASIPLVALMRTITYIGAACSVYVFTRYPGSMDSHVEHVANLAIVALALAIGVFMRFLSQQRFETTPTDYLIALGLVVLAVMDRARVGSGNMVQFVTYLIVLFYGCEIIVGHIRFWRLSLGWPTLGALGLLAYRGLGWGA